MRHLRSQARQDQPVEAELLPGLPNEITFNEIFPKLSWRDFQRLASVHSVWLHAIRSRQVHDARVAAHSTETLALITYKKGNGVRSMALYSVRHNYSCEIPPIHYLGGRMPLDCQCVSLDGKLYVLGGFQGAKLVRANADFREAYLASDQVYMLDVAGQRQWKQCARMQQRRHGFGCCGADGKMYVFGRGCGKCPGSEVYDPKVNKWSPIKPMPSFQSNHHVAKIGEELFVHGGVMNLGSGRRYLGSNGLRPNSLNIYHPGKNEWRVAEPFDVFDTLVFSAGGKFHAMTNFGIYVHNAETNVWITLHSFSMYDIIGPFEDVLLTTVAALPFDDRLLAAVNWHNCRNKSSGSCLVQSTEFGSDKSKIVWQKINVSGPFVSTSPYGTILSMIPIEL